MMKHLVTIEDISYQFAANGSIDSLIEISPGIDVPDSDLCINKIPSSALSAESDMYLARGYHAVLTDNTLKVLQPSKHQPTCLNISTCPICGAPLFTDGTNKFCFNKECIGQLTTNTRMLISALGLNFTGVNLHIFDLLMSDSRVRTPADIFKVDIATAYSYEIPVLDLQLFQQYLHSVRGHTPIEQIIRGLNIYGISDVFIQEVSTAFKSRGLSLLNANLLLQSDFLGNFQTDVNPWVIFIYLEQNRRQFLELCNMLYM